MNALFSRSRFRRHEPQARIGARRERSRARVPRGGRRGGAVREDAASRPGRRMVETSWSCLPAGGSTRVFAKSPIDVAFLGADGTILRTRRALKPGRAAAVRGSQAVIEGRAGFITRAGLAVGDRVALREAQAPRPARDVAPWRSALDEDGDSPPRGAPDAFWDTDAEVDPWDVGSLDAPRHRGPTCPGPQREAEPRRFRRQRPRRTGARLRPAASRSRNWSPARRRSSGSKRSRSRKGSARRCSQDAPAGGQGSSRGRGDRDHSRGGDRPARRRAAGCAVAAARPAAARAERRRAGPARAAQAPGVAGTVALAGVRDDAGVLDEARALRAPRPRQPDTRGVPSGSSGCRLGMRKAVLRVSPRTRRRRSRRRGGAGGSFGEPPPRRWPCCWSPPRRSGCGTRRRPRRRGPSTVAVRWRVRCPRRERQ